jgi:hypothetical protein
MLRLIRALRRLRRRRKLAAPSQPALCDLCAAMPKVNSAEFMPADKAVATGPVAAAQILAPAKVLVGRDPRLATGYEAAMRPSPN